MPGPPPARVGDLHLCNASAIPPPPLPVPIPIGPVGAMTVLIGGQPAARIGDMTTAAPPHPVALGSFTVLVGGMPAARMGDICACGGAITLGCFTVLMG